MQKYNPSDIKDLEPTLYEEESYRFLYYYQLSSPWYVYDSDILSKEFVIPLITSFVSFHGKILFPEKVGIDSSYWSPSPLGIFRFLLQEDFSYNIISPYQVGYIVEGCYWSNGFYYSVYDSDNMIQAKLFVDEQTKLTYNYPNCFSPRSSVG